MVGHDSFIGSTGGVLDSAGRHRNVVSMPQYFIPAGLFCARRTRTAVVVASAWLLANPSFGKTVRVTAPEELARACAEAQPGDTLLLANRVWIDAALKFQAEGTAEQPITLTAEKPGVTTLTGASRLTVIGRHLVVKGLKFEGGALESGAVISLGTETLSAEDCRLTDCAIINYNPPKPSIAYAWVKVRGHRHQIDHCQFEGQNHLGVTLQVVVGDGDNQHRIDHNYFFNRSVGYTNGFESLQLGQAADSHRSSNSIVEYNLFEACDGEQEIISNKSGGNVYRKNTFLRSAGALTLRHGDGCTVENNVFLGRGKPHTGGVRVIGRRHTVRGNYFHGLTGLPTAGAVIAIYAGIPNSVPTGYVEAEGAAILENVLIDNAANGINLSGGYLSRGRTILPRGVRIENNWIDQDPGYGAVVLAGRPGEGLTCSGNFYSPHSEIGYAPDTGFAGLWFKDDPDAPFPVYPPLAPPATTEHEGWRATMAALEPLQPTDVGPRW